MGELILGRWPLPVPTPGMCLERHLFHLIQQASADGPNRGASSGPYTTGSPTNAALAFLARPRLFAPGYETDLQAMSRAAADTAGAEGVAHDAPSSGRPRGMPTAEDHETLASADSGLLVGFYVARAFATLDQAAPLQAAIKMQSLDGPYE